MRYTKQIIASLAIATMIGCSPSVDKTESSKEVTSKKVEIPKMRVF